MAGGVKSCDAGYVSIALMKNTYRNSIGLMCSPEGSPPLETGTAWI